MNMTTQEMTSYFFLYGVYTIPFLALLVDCIVGDPRSRWHPVVLIGSIISFYEKIYYHSGDKNSSKFYYGLLGVLSVIISTLFIGWALLFIAGTIDIKVLFIIDILTLYITISPHALAKAGREIYALLPDHLVEARQKVSWIVGRQTKDMDESEITRATIETIAENTVDGIISPLFYYALLGPLGALGYRAINTMDSMWGYKNERYMYFGRVAAHLDDIANYIPARITFLLIIIASFCLGRDAKKAFSLGLRDAAKHPSPNGGYAEAPVAGALHIRLGGYNTYGTRTSFRAYMGNPDQPLRAIHIKQTIAIMYFCSLEAVLLFPILMHVMEVI